MTLMGRRLPARAVLFVVFCALALNQIRVAIDTWGKFVLRYPGYSDFGNYYLYARVGLDAGWNRLYDLTAQRQEWLALGGSDVMPWFRMIYPPPLAWAAAPFTLMPLPLAFACWFGMLVVLTMLTLRLVAPSRSRLTRWTSVLMALALFPVLFGLALGQVLGVELAAVGAAWWLLSRGRDVPAGLLLTAIVFKPQLAFLVPLALLVSGRWRVFVTWLAATAVIGVVAISTTGVSGLQEYAARLRDASAAGPEFLVPQWFTVPGIFGHGLGTTVLQGLLVILTLVVARRSRWNGPSMAVCLGLVGSILVTPYVHFQDLTILVLAGGIALHARLDKWQRALLATGYLLLLAISYWGMGSLGLILGPALVVIEVIWLLVGWRGVASGGITDGVVLSDEVPLDLTA